MEAEGGGVATAAKDVFEEARAEGERKIIREKGQPLLSLLLLPPPRKELGANVRGSPPSMRVFDLNPKCLKRDISGRFSILVNGEAKWFFKSTRTSDRETLSHHFAS